MSNFRAVDRGTRYLLPPSVDESSDARSGGTSFVALLEKIGLH